MLPYAHRHAQRPVLPSFSKTVLCLVLSMIAVAFSGCGTSPTSATKSQSELESLRVDDRVQYEKALNLMSKGEVDDARKILESLVKRYPDTPEIMMNISLAQYRLGELDSASAHINQLAVLAPDTPAVHNLIGLIAVKQGHFAQAEQAYQTAIELNPRYAYALYNMALLQDVYMQDIVKAVEYYDRYLALVEADENTKNWTEHLRFSISN